MVISHTGLALTPISKASDSLPTAYPPSPYFQNLRCLEIGMVTTRTSILMALVNKYKSTLRSLSFHRVMLLYNTGRFINKWALMCLELARAQVCLTEFRLSYVRLGCGRGQNQRYREVRFKGSKDKTTMVWRGRLLRLIVKDILTAIELGNETPIRVDIDNEDMEDHEGEGEGEEMEDDEGGGEEMEDDEGEGEGEGEN
ncbi:hypothetical protein GGR50DRAFT_293295 [Xylaria sp. CBS 124048]|nr:hypothetical protein GGR50DRAFT_293295 [Xylaria sp. CBS 124048]